METQGKKEGFKSAPGNPAGLRARLPFAVFVLGSAPHPPTGDTAKKTGDGAQQEKVWLDRKRRLLENEGGAPQQGVL